MDFTSYSTDNLQFRYDLGSGTFSFRLKKLCEIDNAWSSFKNAHGTLVTSKDLPNRKVLEETAFPDGKKIVVECAGEGTAAIRQEFTLFDTGYLTVAAEISTGSAAAGTNYICPIGVEGEKNFKVYGNDLKALSAPFDNDKWARFASYPLDYAVESYEFTAVYDEEELCGLVAGSITHDTWKTGIRLSGSGNRLSRLQIYAGAADEQTRDTLPHGKVCGSRIQSPEIFLGWFENYREGLEKYGDLNAQKKPLLRWDGRVPFGWNSWAALMSTLDEKNYMRASDFIHDEIQPNAPRDRIFYMNFDSGWNRIPEADLKNAIEHVRKNGQKPGAYLCPFISGKEKLDEKAEDADGYTYRDILLKDFEGNVLPPVDGLYSLDPTHPGTLAKIRKSAQKVIALGFDYIKSDFLGHGAREGCFYNKSITTGMQAYNYGMKYFIRELGPENAGRNIFISLSIAPIFPHGYGHARRISCDAFGTIDQSEYMLNSLTYLWWMNDRLYRFNDPDHIVLYKTYDKVATTENEARTRLNAAAICGTVMLNSDDYSYEEAGRRAKKILTNEEINAIAGEGETFVPLSGNRAEKAACAFIRRNKDGIYLAAFNYNGCEEAAFRFTVGELGLDRGYVYGTKDLWSKEEGKFVSVFTFTLPPAGSTVFAISKR